MASGAGSCTTCRRMAFSHPTISMHLQKCMSSVMLLRIPMRWMAAQLGWGLRGCATYIGCRGWDAMNALVAVDIRERRIFRGSPANLTLLLNPERRQKFCTEKQHANIPITRVYTLRTHSTPREAWYLATLVTHQRGPPTWHPQPHHPKPTGTRPPATMSSTKWPTRSRACRWRRTLCSWRGWARLELYRSCSTAGNLMRPTRTSRALLHSTYGHNLPPKEKYAWELTTAIVGSHQQPLRPLPLPHPSRRTHQRKRRRCRCNARPLGC